MIGYQMQEIAKQCVPNNISSPCINHIYRMDVSNTGNVFTRERRSSQLNWQIDLIFIQPMINDSSQLVTCIGFTKTIHYSVMFKVHWRLIEFWYLIFFDISRLEKMIIGSQMMTYNGKKVIHALIIIRNSYAAFLQYLAVELLYEIFIYFQFHEVFNIFSNLNSRFADIISNMPFMPVYLGFNETTNLRTLELHY